MICRPSLVRAGPSALARAPAITAGTGGTLGVGGLRRVSHLLRPDQEVAGRAVEDGGLARCQAEHVADSPR